MIAGMGFDLCAIARIKRIMDKNPQSFIRRILTEEEASRLPKSGNAQAEYMAGRFAAKEAAVKALGTGFSQGIGFKDIEITNSESGRPMLSLHGKALEIARKLGAVRFHVSISHERETAGACVILETEGNIC